MDIGEVWALAYRGAKSAGSPEPEDAAQTVILRFLERGRGRGYADVRKPRIYWAKAGRNMAIRQWRKRTASGRVVCISYGLWHCPIIDVEELVLNRVALASIPRWVKDVADRRSHNQNWDHELHPSTAERVRLSRWRRSLLFRKALGYLRETT